MTRLRIIRERPKLGNSRSGRCDRFRQNVVKLRAMLAIFPRFLAGNVLRGTHGRSCVEHRGCLAWNAGNVLLRKRGMSCMEHRECVAWNKRSVLRTTQGMFGSENRERLAWNAGNVLLGTLGMSCSERETDAFRILSPAGITYALPWSSSFIFSLREGSRNEMFQCF